MALWQHYTNRNISSDRLNWKKDMSGFRRSAGRLFLILGPTAEKERSPNLLWVRGIIHVQVSAERSWRVRMLATSWQSSAKYSGSEQVNYPSRSATDNSYRVSLNFRISWTKKVLPDRGETCHTLLTIEPPAVTRMRNRSRPWQWLRCAIIA